MADQPARLSRRKLLLGGAAGAAALSAPWLRPSDNGGAHSDYFLRLQSALREAGLYRPTLVVDRARLNANIARLKQHLPAGFGYRIVGKSLPSLPLIETVRAATGSDRVMVFHQPFLNLVADQQPDSQLLLGKPMPVAAAQRFYQQHRNGAFQPAQQLQWLIDSPERLREYRELARAQQTPMRLNLELDIGLHRGGFTDPSAVTAAIGAIDAEPLLSFSGFMGYEAHASKMPKVIGGPQQALARAMAQYRRCVDAAREALGERFNPDALTLNAGGSSTYQMYDSSAPCNELAVGSALVKPVDFDVATLDDHIPAAFIATPVLKALETTQVPGLEPLSGLFSALDPNSARSFFTYGGYWKAAPESPPGLQINSLYGRSTNQEMLNGSRSVKLGRDDFVFLRPQQSEFVFLQFGDIAVYEDGHISEIWPIFAQGA